LGTATRTKDRLASYATICPEIELNGKFTTGKEKPLRTSFLYIGRKVYPPGKIYR
jgi:hypothetical protein